MIEEEVIQNNDGTETFILHNVPQQQQSKQIIINNPNEIVNYTTSGAQQAQPGMTHTFRLLRDCKQSLGSHVHPLFWWPMNYW